MPCIFRPLLVCLLIASSAHSQSTSKSKASNTKPPPQVEIELQADSPLQVSAWAKWIEIDPRGIGLAVTVTNVSQKAIRAYTTRNMIGVDESHSGSFLMNATKPGKVLQPGQSELRSTWRDYPVDSAAPIHLSLDFAEFTDDSTWGADTCQSAERLDGQRTGARAAIEALQRVLDQNGASAVLKALDKPLDEIVVPLDRSAIWQEDFLRGVENVSQHIRNVNADGGLLEIGPALKQPYDASGYKIEVVKPENQ